ncbi:MAG: S41 family peptidase [Bacillota bacterium]
MGKLKFINDWIVLIVVIVVIILLLPNYLEQRKDKLLVMKEDIINSYYSRENLKAVLKKHLQEQYTGNLEKDFNKFIVNFVVEDLNKSSGYKEREYNEFLSKDEIKQQENLQHNELKGKEITEKIYYFDLSSFDFGLENEKFASHLAKIKQYQNLIIDLRNSERQNFELLQQIAGVFLQKGELIAQLNYRDKNKVLHATNQKQVSFNKITILINNDTKGGAELLTFVLKEKLDNVLTVGTETAGLRISTSIEKFNDGSGLQLVNAVMQKPTKLRKSEGITPDIRINSKQQQLKRAVDVLKTDKVRIK